MPIRLIHDRWIDKYTERQVSALVDLKNELEENGMTAPTRHDVTTQVYRVYIKATPAGDLGRDHEARVDASATATAAGSSTTCARAASYAALASEEMQRPTACPR